MTCSSTIWPLCAQSTKLVAYDAGFAPVRDKPAIHTAFANHRTNTADVDLLVDAVLSVGERLANTQTTAPPASSCL